MRFIKQIQIGEIIYRSEEHTYRLSGLEKWLIVHWPGKKIKSFTMSDTFFRVWRGNTWIVMGENAKLQNREKWD